MRLLLLTIGLLSMLITSGCQPPSSSNQRYHEDGRAKPIVLLQPIFGRGQQALPWDIGQELTCGLRSRLQATGNLYLTSDTLRKSVEAQQAFGPSLDFAKAFYPGHDVILFIEVLEHNVQTPPPVHSVSLLPQPSALLKMSCRLRVIDIKEGKPKVLLQQLVEKSYPLKPFELDIDYSPMNWQDKEYKLTPWHQLHVRMEKEIAQRVESYVCRVRG